MAHHDGDAQHQPPVDPACNDLIYRVCGLFPDNFIGVCQLPQIAGVSPANCIAELERCVNEYGFVGCNINPDPTGGYWTGPAVDRQRYWYPLFEAHGRARRAGDGPRQRVVQPELPRHRRALSERRHVGVHAVPAVGPVQGLSDPASSSSRTAAAPCPTTGAATAASRRTAGRPPLEGLLDNIFFDTCVYHLPASELLAKVIAADNVLFASEMIGAVRGVDPRDRALLRRHQALRRRDRRPVRRGQDQDLRDECAPHLPPARGTSRRDSEKDDHDLRSKSRDEDDEDDLAVGACGRSPGLLALDLAGTAPLANMSVLPASARRPLPVPLTASARASARRLCSHRLLWAVAFVAARRRRLRRPAAARRSPRSGCL